eukprot:scaffold1246_cov117-Isochrysis_galbana.AAC.3
MNEPNVAMSVMTGHSLCAHASSCVASTRPPTSSAPICTYTSVGEILPDGIGRYGSLMASSSRSYQSLMVWVKPHRMGPERVMAHKALIVSSPTTAHESVVGASPKRFQTAW